MLGLSLLTGCQLGSPQPRSEAACAMFAPTTMRIHPIFTRVRDWTGDGKPDGIEALLEFQDQFADPAKAMGTVIFELYEYRAGYPDPRGDRLANPWIASLMTLGEQREHWNRTSRTYSLQLAYPAISPKRNYVLTAIFERAGGGRFFDRMIIEGTRSERHHGQSELPIPTTEPTTRPK
jgi:hypothetical protein